MLASLQEIEEDEDEKEMKEHIEAMFAGTDLSEDFKTKATTIFEAAVTLKAKDKIAKIIIGPTATADDMGNPTKMMKALAKYPEKYKAIKEKYFAAPTVQEWFRKTLDILK